jgi:hypothetical protein
MYPRIPLYLCFAFFVVSSAKIARCDDPFDFRRVRWGMTEAEIRGSEPSMTFAEAYVEGKKVLRFVDWIEGIKVLGQYYLTAEGKTNGGLYEFADPSASESEYLKVFQALHRHLLSEYGAPMTDSLQQSLQIVKTYASLTDFVAARGGILTQWQSGNSSISIVLGHGDGIAKPLAVVIFYSPASLSSTSIAKGELTFVPPAHPEVDEYWIIYLTGPIDEALSRRLMQQLTEKRIKHGILVFDSPGGDLLSAIEIGETARQFHLSTDVGKLNPDGSGQTVPGGCYSACLYAYVGGAFRYWIDGSEIGVHRFSTQFPADNGIDVAQVTSAVILEYLRVMGVDPSIFTLTTTASDRDMVIVPKEELKRLRVINDGYHPAEWTIEVVKGGTYLKGQQESEFGTGKVTLSCDGGGSINFAPFYKPAPGWYSSTNEKDFALRLDREYLPLNNPNVPLHFQGEFYSAAFTLPESYEQKIIAAHQVGFAASSPGHAQSWGFAVDVSTSSAKVETFLNNCLSGVRAEATASVTPEQQPHTSLQKNVTKRAEGGIPIREPDGHGGTLSSKDSPREQDGSQLQTVTVEQFPSPKLYKVLATTAVFSAPSVISQAIARLEPGAKVQVVAKMGKWLELRSAGDRRGYIYGQDAEPADQ